MLNLQDIAQRITEPQMVSATDLETLKNLSSKYPYTQLFSILYLKGLSVSGDVHFDDELQKHSFRIGNRVQLYDLIKSHEEFVNTTKGEAIESSPEIEEPVQVINEPTEAYSKPEVETTNEPELIEEDENITTVVSESGISENPPKDEAEVDTIQNEEIDAPTVESVEIPKEKDVVEENILHHALAANYTLEDLSEDESEKLDRRLAEKEEQKTVEAEPIESIAVDAKQSFTSWLSSDKNHTDVANADKEAINAVVNDFADFDPSEKLFGEVEKPKKEFFSPTKKAKESLREDGLPVSETLAKIYIVQGNYPKAIDAYTQLSLKYPEKKIFFANLIQDLKKKLNT